MDTQPIQPPILLPRKKSLTWLIILVILLILTSTSVLAYKYYQLKTQTAVITPSPTPNQVISPELTFEQDVPIDPTVDWETYQDPQFNYSIQYPTNLIVQHEEGNVVFINDNKASDDDCVGGGCHKGTFTIRMFIQPIITQKELAIIANEEYKSANITVSDITELQSKKFNGFFSYYYEAVGDVLSREYIFRLNPNTVIILSYTYISEDYRNTVDQILSTFKFTN